MVFTVRPVRTPYSVALEGNLVTRLSGLYSSLFLHPGRKSLLQASPTVSSLFSVAYLLDRAAGEGRQVLHVASTVEQREELIQVLQEIYRRPVGPVDANSGGAVMVLTVPELLEPLEAGHGVAVTDVVLFESPEEFRVNPLLASFLTEVSEAGAPVVAIGSDVEGDYSWFSNESVLVPELRVLENPGLTPLASFPAVAQTLLESRYTGDPALHYSRFDYEFARKGSLAERYLVLSQLLGFALLNELDMLWVIERHIDIYGLSEGTLLELLPWCYASTPTDAFTAYFAVEHQAYRQQPVLA